MDLFFILGYFLPFYLPTQKIKIKKNWKKPLEISSFYTCIPKIWLDDVRFLRYGAQQTEEQTDGKSDA